MGSRKGREGEKEKMKRGQEKQGQATKGGKEKGGKGVGWEGMDRDKERDGGMRGQRRVVKGRVPLCSISQLHLR